MGSSVAEIRASSKSLLASETSRKSASTGQVIRWLILFAGGVLMVMPIAYMISTSLKWPHEIYNLALVPNEPHLENYTYVP